MCDSPVRFTGIRHEWGLAMKTASIDGRRWWQLIGPWPLRPWVVFWGVGAVNFIAATAVNRSELLERPLATLVKFLVPILLGTFVFALVLALGARVFPERTPRNLIVYLLYILGGSGIGAAFSYITARLIGVVSAEDIVFVPFHALRGLTWSTFLLALAGITIQRLSQQTRIAEQALAISLNQQELMLVDEERSRRQISALLHDRVQAGLMAACLELRMAVNDQGSVDAESIERIITKIDGIRGIDVRQAARTLSPDLMNVDLRTALTELARIHEPRMKTTLDLTASFAEHNSEFDPDLLLACYRVCEQTMLNSVIHGHATQCHISLSEDSQRHVILVVEDDGKPKTGTMAPGFGSAILDAWCRVLDGDWQLEMKDGGGAVFTATFPVRNTGSAYVLGNDMSRM